MRLVTKDGALISAKQAIHDAFMPDLGSGFSGELAGGRNRGSDARTMDHCTKGFIQSELERLRLREPVAHAWAMLAYAPEGVMTYQVAQCFIIPWLVCETRTKTFEPLRFVRLYLRALRDAVGDARAGKRARQSYVELAACCGCTVEQYEAGFRFVYYNLKDKIIDLDAVALPPVAAMVAKLVEKASGDHDALDDFGRYASRKFVGK